MKLFAVYGKMFLTLITYNKEHFSFFSRIKCWDIRPGIHKIPVRIANKEDPDQTASSEAV